MTLLPTSPPAQLYSFGYNALATEAAGASGSAGPTPHVRLTLASVALPATSAGAGILTTRGDSVAYIARARWAAPASVLVGEAAVQAFPEVGAVLTRSTAGTLGDLSLEVRTFETHYADAPTPSVRIVIHAVITRPDGGFLAERTFAAERRADADRVSAIVAQYDRALSDDLNAIARWSVGQLPTTPADRTGGGSAHR